MKMGARWLAVALFTGMVSMSAGAQGGAARGHWVSAWSAAVHGPVAFPGEPPAPVFENQTIRMVIRPTIGGGRLRMRFSNEFGAAPLVLGSAHIAVVEGDGRIIAGTDRLLTFGGRSSVEVPAGSPMLSDAVKMAVPAFGELAVSIFLPQPTTLSTFHGLGQHDAYISGPGDFTGAVEIPHATVTRSWYGLAGLEVWASEQTAAVVTLGDSITDGYGAKEPYGDWPDQLAKRLAGRKGSPAWAVDNEGIDGNRILHDGAGVSALARLDRDVISRPGVTGLIVLEGINDICWPQIRIAPAKGAHETSEKPFAGQVVTARDLIAGLQQIIERAHEHGIRVFGATITPYEGTRLVQRRGRSGARGCERVDSNGRGVRRRVRFRCGGA